MDWINFAVFAAVYLNIRQLLWYINHPTCDSEVCVRIGWFDDWQVNWNVMNGMNWNGMN